MGRGKFESFTSQTNQDDQDDYGWHRSSTHTVCMDYTVSVGEFPVLVISIALIFALRRYENSSWTSG